MKAKIILFTSIILMSIAFSPANAQTNNSDPKEFVHTVYFWLKNPEDPEVKKNFETSLIKFINSSKYIKTRHIGIPANTNRPVIERSYHYCLSLTFASKADQDKYQTEDVHKTFISESEKLWQKVLVYDSESIL